MHSLQNPFLRSRPCACLGLACAQNRAAFSLCRSWFCRCFLSTQDCLNLLGNAVRPRYGLQGRLRCNAFPVERFPQRHLLKLGTLANVCKLLRGTLEREGYLNLRQRQPPRAQLIETFLPLLSVIYFKRDASGGGPVDFWVKPLEHLAPAR